MMSGGRGRERCPQGARRYVARVLGRSEKKSRCPQVPIGRATDHDGGQGTMSSSLEETSDGDIIRTTTESSVY